MENKIIHDYIGFEWDQGNQNKNKIKHSVSQGECEQIFFNEPLLLFEDKKHSSQENRLFALGKTDDNRKLFVVFTVRNKLIRVISARSMSKQERRIYEETEENPDI